MARRLLGLLVLGAGCLDTNPKFIDPMATTGIGPATASEGTTGAPGETTDDPTLSPTSTAPVTVSTTSVEPSCPDGQVDADEQCDDGNLEDLDECSNACRRPVCGDGVVQGGEGCDDGNISNEDACLADCTPAFCGDGFKDPMSEQCDDANDDASDDCIACVTAVCGDGQLQVDVEQCDDGDLVDMDGCQSDCTFSPKLVFVSSKNFNGDMGGLDGADIRCQMLALAAELPGEFRAWLSSGQGTPLTRMIPSLGPYVLRDGTVVADDWGDLVDGILHAPIDMTETGGAPLPTKNACKPSSVYTNTRPDGMIGAIMTDCMNWSTTNGPAHLGDSKATMMGWSHDCNQTGCLAEAPIYCIEQ
jgi:cysteine-rich repeat protein